MKLSELISISPGFHRSVNVKYDLHDPDKISTYIPTQKSEIVCNHVLSSVKGNINDGATMVIGTYGTGKSHLGTFLGTLLGKKVLSQEFNPLLEKIKSAEVKELILEELQVKFPFLVVPVSGGAKYSLEQQLLYSLKRILINNKLNIEIDTSYTAAVNIITRWVHDYPSTYQALEKILVGNNYGTVDHLLQKINNFDSEALRFFANIYPELASGANFDYYAGDIADVYRSVCLKLRECGYRGIFLIYDEFNQSIDSLLRDNSSLRIFQNLAELASRSEEGFRLHILLISHKTITQYIGQKSDIIADDWHKIEGRFRIFDVSNKPWEDYDLISRVLHKNKPNYYQLLFSNNPEIEKIGQHRRLPNIFEGLSPEILDDVIVQGCLPLHPLTVYILPRISAKLAQNERTLFTFLAGQDGSPLPLVFEQELDKVECIKPWQVFDYFENQLRWSQNENHKLIWKKVRNAVDSVPQDAITEVQVLKTIGIIQVTGSSNLPCTKEILEYALGSNMFNSALKSLEDKRLIYIHRATQEIEIINPVDFDIEGEIELWMQKKPLGVSALSYISKLGIRHYIIPHPYNHEYKITRFLTPAYADADNINMIIANGHLSPIFDGCDGVVCYLFPENQKERLDLMQVVTECHDRRVIFAVPINGISIRDITWRLLALTDIKKNLKSELVNLRVKALIDLYLEDAEQSLRNNLEQVTVPSEKVEYYWCGNNINYVNSERDLSLVVSQKMKKIYKYTPIINNELINKDNPTMTSKRARNDVVDEILRGNSDIRERLRSSQERFMLDTLFIETGLYNDENCEQSLRGVLSVITDFFFDSKDEPKAFEELFESITAAPFGLRKGVIPVFLTACIIKYKKYVTIRNAAGIDCYINAKLLDKIVQAPNNYFVKLDKWNESLERFIIGLTEIFDKQLSKDIFFSNKFGELADVMFRWYTGLPRITRETTRVNQDAHILRSFARVVNRNPKQMLFYELPKALGYNDCSSRDVYELLKKIKSSKEELDDTLQRSIGEIRSRLYMFFSKYGSHEESLISLARNMVGAASKGKTQSTRWANVFSYIIEFDGYDEEKFTYGLAHLLTGIRVEDWLDKTFDDFNQALQDLGNTEQLEPIDLEGPRVELMLFDTNDNKKEVTLYRYEVSELGEILQAHLESAIDDFGDAVTPLEKRQILLNILRNMI